MLNAESLANLNETLTVYSESQMSVLDNRIAQIKQDMSSRGSLCSSTTIQRVATACVDVFHDRASKVTEVLTQLPWEYHRGAAEAIKECIRPHFPSNTGLMRGRLETTILMARGGEDLRRDIMNRIETQRDRIVRTLHTEVDRMILLLKKRATFSLVDKVLITIEIIALIGIAFLAGQSYASEGSNKSLIVALGVFAPFAEIGRQVLRRVRGTR